MASTWQGTGAAVATGQAAVYRTPSVTSGWPALVRWTNLTYLAKALPLPPTPTSTPLHGGAMLHEVKVCPGSTTALFSDSDADAPLLARGVVHPQPTPFTTRNMTAAAMLGAVFPGHDAASEATCSLGSASRFGYFSPVPDALANDAHPIAPLFASDRDLALNKAFVWVSSAGVQTHTHFDQDHNFFVQVVGHKRFTLFPSAMHEEMYVYPRIHPLWHKSQMRVQGETRSFPRAGFAREAMQTVVVGPGDVLYIPPYTWHHVETLTPSISLAILSHETTVTDAMSTIYKLNHKFDLLQDAAGKRYALRLFFDIMIHELVGNRPDETRRYFEHLLHSRYSHLGLGLGANTSAAPAPAVEVAVDATFCTLPSLGGKVPTAQHVYGSCVSDARLVTAQFARIQPASARDLLFADYVEEIAAEVVTAAKVVPFFQHCFQGQEYDLTDPGSDEHQRLWRYYDEEDDEEDDGPADD